MTGGSLGGWMFLTSPWPGTSRAPLPPRRPAGRDCRRHLLWLPRRCRPRSRRTDHLPARLRLQLRRGVVTKTGSLLGREDVRLRRSQAPAALAANRVAELVDEPLYGVLEVEPL